MQRDAVHDRAHAELAHAVVQIVAALQAAIVRMDVDRSFPVGQIRAGQVRRAAQQFRQRPGERGDRLLRGLACRNRLRRAVRVAQHRADRIAPLRGQRALRPALELSGFMRIVLTIGFESLRPVAFSSGAPLAGVPERMDLGRHRKRRMLPAERASRVRGFIGTERRAVHIVRPCFRWRAFADHRLAADQRRPARCARSTQCPIDRVDVVSIHVTLDVPAIGRKTRRRVVAEPLRDVAVDRDAVVVVQHRELVELQRTGERGRLVRDAFHQAAVSGKHVGAVIHDRMAGPVEFTREQRLGERHADRIGQSLPERPRGRFDAGRDAHFGMPRRLAVQLPEAPEFVDRQVVAGEMQQARTTASSHARSTAQSGRGRATQDCADCVSDGDPTARRRSRPCRAACPDDPI